MKKAVQVGSVGPWCFCLGRPLLMDRVKQVETMNLHGLIFIYTKG